MQDRMEKNRLREYSTNDIESIKMREKELLSHRDVIQNQEKQFDEYRSKLKEDQFIREKKLQRELEEREEYFVEREVKLAKRQREFEKTFQKKQLEAEKLRRELKEKVEKKESELIRMHDELQKEKELYKKDVRKKIEQTSRDYVSETLDSLEKKENEFHRRSKSWGAIGALSIVIGLLFFMYITITTFTIIPDPVTWQFITFTVFKGLIVVILFAALAKYSLIFSNSYMRESLKYADRKHAINFGKFYLESYGASADWKQIKEAFEHWNIKGENAFSKPEDSEFKTNKFKNIADAIDRRGK